MKKLLLILTKNITMKRILILLCLPLLFTTCKKEDDDVATINGCMDPNATNYNPLATNDDGSCEYVNLPVANFSYTASNDFAPTLFVFTNYSANSDTYYWDFGDGNFSNEENPTHLYTLGGDYTVSLTASILDHEDIFIDTITVNSAPSRLTLSSIKIDAIPMTNNGSDWDWDITGLTSDPDIFYVLKQGGIEVASSSSQDNISVFPILFTENLPYAVNNLSQDYTIELWDNDVVAGIGGNELIGSCSFTPNNYAPTDGSKYPTEINIISSGVDMTLDVQWLQ
tara:strand:- start:72 stop:920 length:849 start_codon:yes stop_codon:yes gene_type:complete